MLKNILLLSTILLSTCSKKELSIYSTDKAVSRTEETSAAGGFQFITKEPVLFLKTLEPKTLLKSKSKIKLNHKKVMIAPERTLSIYGEVNEGTLEVAGSIKNLDRISTDPIFILIDSPGGSVFDGARVVSEMQNAKSPIYTVCIKFCASMAFIIHQYGTKRYMLDRSVLMSHFASSGTEGDVDRMKAYINLIDVYVTRFSTEIAERAGMTVEDYTNKIAKDLWMTEQDAKELNFSDGTVNVVY